MAGKDPRKHQSNLGVRWFLHAVVYVAPMACAGVPPNELEANALSALVGGSLSPAERDAVVFVRANHDDGAFDDCSGTLLSPRVLITAKHCVTLVQPGKFVCTGAGSLREDGLGAGLFGAKFASEKLEVFPGTAPVGTAAAHGLATFTTESSDACHDDVAAVVLDTPIPQDSYPSLRVAARPTVVGETVRLVGYGATEHDKLVERHEVDNVRIIDVGRDDGVLDPNATTPARSLVVGGGTACFGDSGGPALSMTTGALVGVYSRIAGDCFAAESRNTYMLASSFFELFSRAFELAGEQPLLEPSLEPVGPAPVAAAGASGTMGGAGARGTTLDVGRTSTATLEAAGAGAVVVGANASGGVPVGAGGSRGQGVAGVGTAVAEPAASTRHEALRCSLGRTSAGAAPGTTRCWLLVALAVGFSRRRFGRYPCGGD